MVQDARDKNASVHFASLVDLYPGDNVNVDCDFQAVFCKTQMSAAKLFDTISRLFGIFAQIRLNDLNCLARQKLSSSLDKTTSKSSTTRNLSWKSIYAVTCWQDHCGKEHWKSPKGGWESMYFHRETQLFLSVYADDFNVVGENKNLGLRCWKK